MAIFREWKIVDFLSESKPKNGNRGRPGRKSEQNEDGNY